MEVVSGCTKSARRPSAMYSAAYFHLRNVDCLWLALCKGRRCWTLDSDPTPWNRVIESLAGPQLAKTFCTCGTRGLNRVHSSLPLVRILNQMCPVHALPFYFFTILYNIILPVTPGSVKLPLSFKFLVTMSRIKSLTPVAVLLIRVCFKCLNKMIIRDIQIYSRSAALRAVHNLNTALRGMFGAREGCCITVRFMCIHLALLRRVKQTL